MIRMQYVVGNGVQLAGELGISSSVVCLGRAIAEATASAIRRSGIETN